MADQFRPELVDFIEENTDRLARGPIIRSSRKGEVFILTEWTAYHSIEANSHHAKAFIEAVRQSRPETDSRLAEYIDKNEDDLSICITEVKDRHGGTYMIIPMPIAYAQLLPVPRHSEDASDYLT